MKGIIKLDICEKCKKVKKHGEWIFPCQESLNQMRELYASGQLEFNFIICPICRPK